MYLNLPTVPSINTIKERTTGIFIVDQFGSLASSKLFFNIQMEIPGQSEDFCCSSDIFWWIYWRSLDILFIPSKLVNAFHLFFIPLWYNIKLITVPCYLFSVANPIEDLNFVTLILVSRK